MYINGIYVSESPYLIQRTDEYKNIDIMVSTGPSSLVGTSILNDYEHMGSGGYCIWGTTWPTSITALGPKERLSKYEDLTNTSAVGKELLFFKDLPLSTPKGVMVIHSLGTHMDSLNVGFVLRHLRGVSLGKESQVVMVMDVRLYEDHRVSSYISSDLGLLII